MRKRTTQSLLIIYHKFIYYKGTGTRKNTKLFSFLNSTKDVKRVVKNIS